MTRDAHKARLYEEFTTSVHRDAPCEDCIRWWKEKAIDLAVELDRIKSEQNPSA